MEELKLSGNFSSLLEEANFINSNCSDYQVSNIGSSNFHYDPYFDTLKYTTDEKEQRELPMSDHSFSQLCGKLGVPVNYINKCKDSKKVELIGDNLNTWIEGSGKNLMVREYSSTVRGILSSRYSVFDSHEIIEVLAEQFNDYTVKGSFVSPERLHIRAIDKNNQLPISGEDLFAGVQIDSSDVGRSTLVVRSMIFKQVCTNGLVLPQDISILFKQKHMGITHKEFEDGVTEGLKQHPLHIAASVEAIIKAREVKITLGESTDKVLREVVLMGDSDIEKANELISGTYGETAFGMTNAITEIAQLHTLERRLQMEEIAGNLLMRMVA